jgi:hypothetical protein
MAQAGTQLSFDVRDNRTIFYTMHSRVAEQARHDLAEQIRHVHGKEYKPTNPIIETAKIVRLAESSDPQQSAIGQLMGMVESLREEVSALRQGQHGSGINLLLSRSPSGWSRARDRYLWSRWSWCTTRSRSLRCKRT